MNSKSREMATALREEHKEKLQAIYAPMTEEIDLPSGGQFYKSGASTVKIKPMTAKEEDILSNDRLIKSGRVFDELIKSCVVDWNGIEFNELFVGDKNTILIAIRVISLGDNYDVDVTCPSCSYKNKISVSLLSDLGHKKLQVEPVKIGVNEFHWVSPKNINFRLRLLNHQDQIDMAEENKRRKIMFKNNYQESPATDLLNHSILSIEDITDRMEILELIGNMPSSELRALISYISEITPDYDMKYLFTCSECDHEAELQIPMSVGFFWPEGGSTTK